MNTNNTTGGGLNGYVCHYRGKRCEVRAATTLDAQKQAAAIFKARKQYEVSVTLAELANGVPVVHLPLF